MDKVDYKCPVFFNKYKMSIIGNLLQVKFKRKLNLSRERSKHTITTIVPKWIYVHANSIIYVLTSWLKIEFQCDNQLDKVMQCAEYR